jgi:hypothetical protein
VDKNGGCVGQKVRDRRSGFRQAALGRLRLEITGLEPAPTAWCSGWPPGRAAAPCLADDSFVHTRQDISTRRIDAA